MFGMAASVDALAGITEAGFFQHLGGHLEKMSRVRQIQQRIHQLTIDLENRNAFTEAEYEILQVELEDAQDELEQILYPKYTKREADE